PRQAGPRTGHTVAIMLRQLEFPKGETHQGGAPSSSVSIVRRAATASRVALRSATPTLDPAATHLVLAPTRKAGTKQLIGTISRRSPRLLGARSKPPFR